MGSEVHSTDPVQARDTKLIGDYLVLSEFCKCPVLAYSHLQ